MEAMTTNEETQTAMMLTQQEREDLATIAKAHLRDLPSEEYLRRLDGPMVRVGLREMDLCRRIIEAAS